MTKSDKYHLFDRDCPFKEIWLNPDDRIKYIEVRKRLTKIGKKALNDKSHSKK